MAKKPTEQPVQETTPVDAYVHTYVCQSKKCLESANPSPGSWHQRCVHLASDQPRDDVKCPGCGTHMLIARTSPPETWKLDRYGNIEDMGEGEVLIFPAPGQPDQTADIEKENA